MSSVLEDVLRAVEPFKLLLSVTEEGDYIIVKPTEYIADKQTYSDIGKVMHGFNAEYMKLGKMSHWRVFKARANPKLSLAVEHVQKATQLIGEALQELKQAGY